MSRRAFIASLAIAPLTPKALTQAPTQDLTEVNLEKALAALPKGEKLFLKPTTASYPYTQMAAGFIPSEGSILESYATYSHI